MSLGKNQLPLSQKVRQPLYLPETVNILKALEEFRKAKKNIAFIFDEFGNFEGVASLHDIMEEIAGELPDQTEIPEIVRIRPGVFRIEGDAILTDITRVTGFTVPANDQYHTMAGFILDYLQRMPELGEKIALAKWSIEVIKVDGNSIEAVRLTNLAQAAKAGEVKKA